jgi:outer membrane protein OmpA-like peptidoglycan-associated protein
METQMSGRKFSWRGLAVAGAILLLAACAQTQTASNPPPAPPPPNATWFTVNFASGSYTIDPQGHKVVREVIAFMQKNPNTTVTIIGRTDTVGSKDYNMHLSHRRADAVRDLLVYNGKVTMDRVETRWTGEVRQGVPTPDEKAAKENRVVDLAVH